MEAIEEICQEDNFTSEFGLPTHDKDRMDRIENLINEYAAQHSVPPTGLNAAQKEEVRQMIQSALDTGSA